MTQKNPKNQQIDLEVIILNYNTEFWLKQALLSIKEFVLGRTVFQISVTVVDNNSSDTSVKMLKSQFPWVQLIESTQNNGFAAGNNLALAKSQARYCMLLNSDIECSDLSNLDALIAYMDEHSEVAVISPRLVLTDGDLDWACHRGEPTLWASFCYFSKLEKLFPKSKFFGEYHLSYLNLNSVHQIGACSGAALLVRRSLFSKVGLLDEQFFMYAEDLDWCKRFREAGYSIIFFPDTEITHHKNKSGISSPNKKTSKKSKLAFYETMLTYYDKHYTNRYPKWMRSVVQLAVQYMGGVR